MNSNSLRLILALRKYRKPLPKSYINSMFRKGLKQFGMFVIMLSVYLANTLFSTGTLAWFHNYGQDLGEIAVCFLRQDDLYLELPTTGEHSRRHFGSKRVLRRKFLGHWLSRYPNSSSTFKLSRLPISCDVNPNSDPTTKRDCPSCSRTVARNHRALDCNLCRGTFHIKCGKVTPTEFKQMQKSKQKSWSCPTCTERQF